MKTVAAIAVCLVSLTLQTPAPARIVLDGEFDDWAAIPVGTSDPAGDASDGVDLREVRVAAGERFVSVFVQFGGSVMLNAMRGSVVILFDEDRDPATGLDVHGMRGVDLEIVPGWKRDEPGTRRISTSARRGAIAGPIPAEFAPKWASDRMEVRIERRGREAPVLAGRQAAVKVVSLKNGRAIDETAIVSIELPPFALPRTPGPDERIPQDDPLGRRDGATLRVATWNLLGFQRAKPWDKVTQILGAIDADVWLLTELAVKSPEQVTAWLPPVSPGAPAWRVTLKGELAIAVRGQIDDIFAEPLLPPAATFYDALSEIFFGRSTVAAAAAVTTVGNRRVFTVPLHLPCCGAVLERAEESRVLRAAIAGALPAARADAVIVGGDFNTLGNLVPLDTLRAGSDVDGSSLEIIRALQLDGLSATTYRPMRGVDGALAASRLDWLLYSKSSLELRNAFVFDSTDLSPYWLRHHGVAADASAATSDHLPVVADFKWRR